MMVIEMRKAAKERAFDLVEESHEIGHEMKMVLCELEDALYDCFEDSEEEKEEKSDEGTDLGFKSKYNRHYAMRNFDDEDEDEPHHYRRAMRMRRSRMNR